MAEAYPPALPFRPSSLDDFHLYAKALSRVIEEPLQRSQQLLARAYGYDDLRALQLVMREAGVAPGPFESAVLKQTAAVGNLTPYAREILNRPDRLIKLVLEAKKLDSVPSRYDNVYILGLFDTPAEHRIARRRVFNALNVLEGKPVLDVVHAEKTGIAAYAGLDQTDTGEYYTRLTKTGAAVRDSLDEIMPGPGAWSSERLARELKNQRQAAREMGQRYPDCPWPLAQLVINHSDYVSKARWTGFTFHWADDVFRAEVSDEFKERIAVAKELFPDVAKAYEMFEPLYGDVRNFVSPLYLPEDQGILLDVTTWQDFLGWGGMAAELAGRRDYAVRLLGKLAHMESATGSHWAKDVLVAQVMGAGVKAVCDCYSTQRNNWESVERNLAMAAVLALENPEKAAGYFLRALFKACAIVDIFCPDRKPAVPLGDYIGDATAQQIESFMYLSSDFWREHPEVMQFLRHIAAWPAVIEPVLEFHHKKRNEFDTCIDFDKSPLSDYYKVAEAGARQALTSFRGM